MRNGAGMKEPRNLMDLVPTGRCLTCEGMGRIGAMECQSCGGSGAARTVPNGDPCILCNGTGIYTRSVISANGRSVTPIRSERCMTCNGVGHVPRRDYSRLPAGWLSIPLPE